VQKGGDNTVSFRAGLSHLSLWDAVLISINFHHRRDRPRDARREAIDDTNRFLNWALAQERGIRRIPCRRVDRGGFTGWMANRGTRALVQRFWDDVLERARIDR